MRTTARWRLHAAAALSASLAGDALGQALPLPERPRFVFQHVGEAEGFGTKTITSLRQDRVGFLWIGTQDGLYRYDGSSFVRFTSSDPADRYVAEIVESPGGALWVVAGGEPSRVDSAGLTRFPLPGARVHGPSALAFDGKGRLYAGTDTGLLRFEVESRRLRASPLPA